MKKTWIIIGLAVVVIVIVFIYMNKSAKSTITSSYQEPKTDKKGVDVNKVTDLAKSAFDFFKEKKATKTPIKTVPIKAGTGLFPPDYDV
jgi:hypothetical protein